MDPTERAPEQAAEAAFEQARHWLGAGRPERAEATLRRALAQAPEDPDLHALLAAALEDLGRRAEAGAEAERALTLDPEHRHGLSLLARIAHAEGRNRAAEGHLLTALRLDPHDAHLLVQYAELMQDTGHLEKAERLLQAALRSDPEHSEAHSLLAIVLAERRAAGRAADHGGLGARLAPDGPLSHAALGYACYQAGRPFAARRHFREALRIEPSPALEEAFLEVDQAARWIYLPAYYWSLLLERTPGRQFTIWAVMFGGLLLLERVGVSDALLLPVVLSYVGFVIYTWFAGLLVRAWVKLRPPR